VELLPSTPIKKRRKKKKHKRCGDRLFRAGTADVSGGKRELSSLVEGGLGKKRKEGNAGTVGLAWRVHAMKRRKPDTAVLSRGLLGR